MILPAIGLTSWKVYFKIPARVNNGHQLLSWNLNIFFPYFISYLYPLFQTMFCRPKIYGLFSTNEKYKAQCSPDINKTDWQRESTVLPDPHQMGRYKVIWFPSVGSFTWEKNPTPNQHTFLLTVEFIIKYLSSLMLKKTQIWVTTVNKSNDKHKPPKTETNETKAPKQWSSGVKKKNVIASRIIHCVCNSTQALLFEESIDFQ